MQAAIMNPVRHATMTTVGLIRHMPVKVLVEGRPVEVMAPVKLVIEDPANGLQAPDLRGKNLVFALPGGQELEIASWI